MNSRELKSTSDFLQNSGDLKVADKVVEVVRFLTKWMEVEPIALNKFGIEIRATIRDRISEYSKYIAIRQRIQVLNNIAQRRRSSSTEFSVKVFVLIVGSLVYSSAVRIYASTLGNLVWPAALFGGFLASFIVDDLATHAATKYARRQFTHAYLSKLSNEKKRAIDNCGNEFRESFWNTQIDYILNIEGSAISEHSQVSILGRKFDPDFVLAALLSIIEFCASILVVTRIGVLNGAPMPILAMTAILPVAITWLASRVQAQWFGIPNHAIEMLEKYTENAQILKRFEESADEWYHTLARLDVGIQAILNERSDNQYPTLQLHELAYDIEYPRKQAEMIEDQSQLSIENCKQICKNKINQLASEYPDLCPQPECTLVELEEDLQKHARDKKEWIIKETKKLIAKRDKEIKRIQDDAQQKISEYRIKEKRANQKYNEALLELEEHKNFAKQGTKIILFDNPDRTLDFAEKRRTIISNKSRDKMLSTQEISNQDLNSSNSKVHKKFIDETHNKNLSYWSFVFRLTTSIIPKDYREECLGDLYEGYQKLQSIEKHKYLIHLIAFRRIILIIWFTFYIKIENIIYSLLVNEESGYDIRN